VTTDALATALGALLTSDVEITVRDAVLSPFDGTVHGVHLEATTSGARLVVEPEPALLTGALGRLLGRAVGDPPTDPRVALDPALAGALAALCVESARRSGTLLEFLATREAPPSSHGLRLDVTVRLDGKPYAVRVWSFAETSPTRGESAPDLTQLGKLSITVPLVGAVSEGSRAEIESLGPGDVWLPGDGWLYLEHGAAHHESPMATILQRACLAAPSMEQGVETGRSDDEKIVLRASIVELGAEPKNIFPRAHDERNPAMSEPEETLREIALQAPVVVRVEVASVTLTAREWAGLGPGDVIETGVPLENPVVLRVAGREVARGELVNVDGELGVRIRQIVDPGRGA
jgi:flagellar motor switch/type III secretory pathway protein FliN